MRYYIIFIKSMFKHLNLSATKNKSEAAQQRSQLMKMVVDKLYKDYGRKNMTNQYIIEEIAKKYF